MKEAHSRGLVLTEAVTLPLVQPCFHKLCPVVSTSSKIGRFSVALPSDYPKEAVAIVLGERRFDLGVDAPNQKVARAYVAANYCFSGIYEPLVDLDSPVTKEQIGE